MTGNIEFIRKVSTRRLEEYKDCELFVDKQNSKLVQDLISDVNVSVYAVSPHIPTARILVASSLGRRSIFEKIPYVVFDGPDFQPERVQGTTPDREVNALHYEYRHIGNRYVDLADAIVAGEQDILEKSEVRKIYECMKQLEII